jgi:soluble lytic murein transglycosylase-like protein
MRIVFALAALVFTSPAFAHGHSQRYSHHAARAHHHYAHYHRAHFAYARPARIESGYAMQPFARTDAAQAPMFSDPSFPNRTRMRSARIQNDWSQNSWSQNSWSQNSWSQNSWSQNSWSQNSWSQNSWSQNAWPEPSPSIAPQQYSGFGEPARRVTRSARVHDGALDAMIARHAAANGLPVSLVHRVVTRESGYNPRASHAGNIGLMQIRYATARGIGYTGSPAGLLNAETNLTYAVRYLAGAYRAAGGNASRAVAFYASGYHGRGVRTPVVTAASSWHTTPVSMQTEWGDAPRYRRGRLVRAL